MIKNPIFWAGILAIIFLVLRRDEITPVASPPTPPPVKPAAMPMAPEKSAGTALELAQEFSTAQAALPLKAEVEKMHDEEVHHLRELNNRLGKAVGELSEAANQDPRRREQTLQFFLRCAEDSEIIDSARALCWWKLTNKINEWKVFIPLSDAKVPLDIQRLAASINPDEG